MKKIPPAMEAPGVAEGNGALAEGRTQRPALVPGWPIKTHIFVNKCKKNWYN